MESAEGERRKHFGPGNKLWGVERTEKRASESEWSEIAFSLVKSSSERRTDGRRPRRCRRSEASHSSFRTRFRCFKRPPTEPPLSPSRRTRARTLAKDGLRRKLSTRIVGQLHCWFPASKVDLGGQETQGHFRGDGDDHQALSLTLMTIPIRRDPTPPPQREMDFGRTSRSGRSIPAHLHVKFTLAFVT